MLITMMAVTVPVRAQQRSAKFLAAVTTGRAGSRRGFVICLQPASLG